MGKKNPYITTIGFNRDDPEHIYVAEFLNNMSRGKAQYIVKAVLLYQNMLENGETVPNGGATYEYERIRSVVLQVIEERERNLGMPAKEVLLNETPKKQADPKEDMLTSLDDDALSGIMASLAAFQQQ